MAVTIKTCRVCGKSYEACRTINRTVGVFRWQEVACSPECGSVYLNEINKSRGITDTIPKVSHKKNGDHDSYEDIITSRAEPVFAETFGDMASAELK